MFLFSLEWAVCPGLSLFGIVIYAHTFLQVEIRMARLSRGMATDARVPSAAPVMQRHA
jgi:hypothetical protein